MDYLRKNGIIVPEYLVIENKKTFFTESSQLPYYFYLTKEIINDGDTAIMSDGLVKEIIKHVSDLHLKTLSFSQELPGITIISDYQNLITLYLKYSKLFDNCQMTECIIKILEQVPDQYTVHPIHSDIYSANIFTRNGHFVAFVDFSDLRFSGFEDDLGKLFQNLIGAKEVPIEQIDRYISLYEQYTSFSLSKKNLCISIFYHILERFVDKSIYGVEQEYKTKVLEILIRLIDHFI